MANRATSLLVLGGGLLFGCANVHDRRIYPVREVRVDEATCTNEGMPLRALPFARRFGPYTPSEASRWLGGALAWSRDGAVLVASQDSRFGVSDVGRAPSAEGLIVFGASRSCLRATAFLDAPTEELGASLAVSRSGNLIAAAAFVPRPRADGFDYTEVAVHLFQREGATFASREPIAARGDARVAFIGERLGVLGASAVRSQLAVFDLNPDATPLTDLIRTDDPEDDRHVASSPSGEFAAIVGLSGRVTLVRFDGASSTFATILEPGVYDGLPPSVSVADTGRVALFQGASGQGVIRIVDAGREGPAVSTGWPGYAFNPASAALSAAGDRIAWTMTTASPTGANFGLVVAEVSRGGVIEAPVEIPLTEGCETPWFVRSLAFAPDGRLAVGAMCGDTRGALFVFE